MKIQDSSFDQLANVIQDIEVQLPENLGHLEGGGHGGVAGGSFRLVGRELKIQLSKFFRTIKGFDVSNDARKFVTPLALRVSIAARRSIQNWMHGILLLAIKVFL